MITADVVSRIVGFKGDGLLSPHAGRVRLAGLPEPLRRRGWVRR
jgi:hypothetical protein